MPDLRRGKAQRGGGDTGIGRGNARVGSDRGNRRECADAGSAIRAPRDPGIGGGGNVDQRAF